MSEMISKTYTSPNKKHRAFMYFLTITTPIGVISKEQRMMMHLLGQDCGYGFDFNEPSRYRDVKCLGNCDDLVMELAVKMGWGNELTALWESAKQTFAVKPTDTIANSVDTKPSDHASAAQDELSPLSKCMHISGTWRGTMESQDAAACPVEFVLSCTHSKATHTSAFGIRRTSIHSTTDGAQTDTSVLVKGTWVAATGNVALTSTDGFEYTFALSHAPRSTTEDGRVTLTGTWKHPDAESSGKISVMLKPPKTVVGDRVVYSGLWVGEAVPADHLQSDTPTNPIKWAMTCAQDADGRCRNVQGAGFFDDSGDIPDYPILFYTLCGGTENEFVKKYEPPVPDFLTVQYSNVNVLTGSSDGQPCLTGSWTNALEGTSGTFASRLEDTDSCIL